jgi:hypothetical protein
MRRLTLSVRQDPRGGPVADEVAAPVQPGPHLTLLIHGYQNTEEAARASYALFLRHSDLARSRTTGDICEVYWPGDTNWPGSGRGTVRNLVTTSLSVLSYPLQLAQAKESAARLREYLERIAGGGPLEIALVCHSLGNRVALELIAACQQNGPDVHVVRACLMACAVPVELVLDAGPLNQAATTIEKSLVLYSGTDATLGWEFDMGQAFGGEYTSGAVGLTGYPPGLWSRTADMAPYDHGDYWPQRESAWEARALFGRALVRYTLTRPTRSRRLLAWLGVPHRWLPGRRLMGDLDG